LNPALVFEAINSNEYWELKDYINKIIIKDMGNWIKKTNYKVLGLNKKRRKGKRIAKTI
jgi:hypothetical protein